MRHSKPSTAPNSEAQARKEAYSLGFETAKKIYMYKMVPRPRLLRIYGEIATAYKQTTGIESDLFIEWLEDKQERKTDD